MSINHEYFMAVMGKNPDHWNQYFPTADKIVFVKFRKHPDLKFGCSGEDEIGTYIGIYVRVSDGVVLKDITPANCDPYVMQFKREEV